MSRLIYTPEVFAVADEDAAKRIILTPQGGQSPDERWVRETPYLLDLIAAEMPVERDALVIDFGAGIGRLAKELIARFGCRVLGVDISQQMRGLAPSYVGSERFATVSPEVFAAMVQSGFRADAAISIWVLQHCADPAQDIDLIESALKPGAGFMVVNNENRAVPTREAQKRGVIWASDGLSVRELLSERFETVSEGRLDPNVVGTDVADGTFWAAYRRPVPPEVEARAAASDAAVQMYQTRSGPLLALRGDYYITGSLETYGEFSPMEGRALKQMIRPGMTVVEIGANMGTHSVDMARACAPGPFYAFEPQPRIFQILRANLALNDVANAFAYPDACGEAEGEAIVPVVDYAQAGNFGGLELQAESEAGVRVRVRPLDSLQLAQCGLLKIDVEGFEPQVLRGARETIARCRPLIYIENDRSAQQQEVISLLAGMGYRMYWHTPPLFHPDNFKGAQEDIFNHVVSVNMFCTPAERGMVVEGLQEIDPTNWTCPVALKR